MSVSPMNPANYLSPPTVAQAAPPAGAGGATPPAETTEAAPSTSAPANPGGSGQSSLGATLVTSILKALGITPEQTAGQTAFGLLSGFLNKLPIPDFFKRLFG